MRRYLSCIAMLISASALFSCHTNRQSANYYQIIETSHENTAEVTWNPEDFDFEAANSHYMEHYRGLSDAKSAGGCSSWRNGSFHGRNLDWTQKDFGCLIIKMPKGGNVKHSSVATVNGNSAVNEQLLASGQIEGDNIKYLPCAVVDGINDAGVAVNINIVPHSPLSEYIKDGDLSSQCVVRYVLDNAGSVDEAIALLEKRQISQSIVELVDDETHYMISDKNSTAVVEFDNGQMVVTRFSNNGNGYYSENGTPAIMTNLYDFAIERWGFNTEEFHENHPFAMGTERWETIKNQYDRASKSVDDNFEIAKSVWYFKNFVKEKKPWYSENAISTAYGKDQEGWYYILDDEKTRCSDQASAQHRFWDGFMEEYWARYDMVYGQLADPHVADNKYWETSHSVVYDLEAKKGYLLPFENFYSKDSGKMVPIEITLP